MYHFPRHLNQEISLNCLHVLIFNGSEAKWFKKRRNSHMPIVTLQQTLKFLYCFNIELPSLFQQWNLILLQCWNLLIAKHRERGEREIIKIHMYIYFFACRLLKVLRDVYFLFSDVNFICMKIMMFHGKYLMGQKLCHFLIQTLMRFV